MSEEKQEQVMINEPKAISLKDRSFTANGKKYWIADKISVDRWKQYEKLVPRLTYSTDFKQLHANLTKAFQLLNKPSPEPLNAGIIIHNILNGIKDADDEKNVPSGLLMCTLVMNREGEDTSVFDEQIAQDKINDWREEGLDILSFFAWAMQSINGFRETYLLYIQAQAQEVIEKTDVMQPTKEIKA